MRVTTKVRRKDATIARATVTETIRTSAPITTRRRTIVQDWATVTCTSAIFEQRLKTATTPKIPTGSATTGIEIATVIEIAIATVIETVIGTTIAAGAATGICMASSAARSSCGRRP